MGRKKKSNNDPFGFGSFDTELSSFSKRVTFENSKFRGKLAEDSFALEQTLQGKKVKRIHKGGDFVVQDTDMFGRNVGKPVTYEVKCGPTAKLSKAQKKNKKRLGKRFKEVRYS